MTRICVFGDVHGNLPAFEAVIAHAGECDAWWCVGDTVGYGPYPNECARRMGEIEALSVVGNHDLGSIGGIDLINFNPTAREACEWTGRELEGESLEYLAGLPLRLQVSPDVLLVHGSPIDPVWEYILSAGSAYANYAHYSEQVCFHGHSHVPAVFRRREDKREKGEESVELMLASGEFEFEVEDGYRYFINVGSVGQPRDGDPRASYVAYRPRESRVSFHRVEYPVERVQEEIEHNGLPQSLARRLAIGR